MVFTQGTVLTLNGHEIIKMTSVSCDFEAIDKERRAATDFLMEIVQAYATNQRATKTTQ